MMSGACDKKEVMIDSSRMESSSANVFEVFSSPGEIVLAFGTTDVKRGGTLPANLANRIILSPYIAKELAILLTDRIHEYESLTGALTQETSVFNAEKERSLRDDVRQYASEENAEKANAIMQMVDNLGVEYCLEHSFKISDRSLLMNRFIMGFSKEALPGNPDETACSIFARLGMPERFMEESRKLLPDAAFIHFGFEEQQNGCLYKVYLEFRKHGELDSLGTQPIPPFNAYLGFKWNPFDNRNCAVSRYVCYPQLSLEEIHGKLASLSEGASDNKSFATARNILSSSVGNLSTSEIIYEEVSEGNNPRKSFDINLYDADLRIRDIYPFLSDISRHYSVPDDIFIPLCDRISAKRFGHLSGGVDREGKDFLTVYYGVEECKGNGGVQKV